MSACSIIICNLSFIEPADYDYYLGLQSVCISVQATCPKFKNQTSSPQIKATFCILVSCTIWVTNLKLYRRHQMAILFHTTLMILWARASLSCAGSLRWGTKHRSWQFTQMQSQDGFWWRYSLYFNEGACLWFLWLSDRSQLDSGELYTWVRSYWTNIYQFVFAIKTKSQIEFWIFWLIRFLSTICSIRNWNSSIF